ncbi:hypothetical protein C0Q70_14832 [Pomacea canaliculata]|uniref:GST N-terminal domain-containing protein n=2 Tax=Pomacea canaliculata TaxID=400727 RepID=A0A2T7NT60_POMCA|nr:hypothetical protein C0Q70_14832 [Pomacea canaliculata]
MCPRFIVYVKAATNGETLGDCPFCQHVCMVMFMKMPENLYIVYPVNLQRKPTKFLELNPLGKVPVLEDTEMQVVVKESFNIVSYIHNIFPLPKMFVGYKGRAKDFCAEIFPMLVTLLKNKDPKLRKEHLDNLLSELSKLNDYLLSYHKTGPYLLGPNLSDLDCTLLPQLRHVLVAGHYYQNFLVPAKMVPLHMYLMHGLACKAFRRTCCPVDEIIKGWAVHKIDLIEPVKTFQLLQKPSLKHLRHKHAKP